jgi:hypothetical protein
LGNWWQIIVIKDSRPFRAKVITFVGGYMGEISQYDSGEPCGPWPSCYISNNISPPRRLLCNKLSNANILFKYMSMFFIPITYGTKIDIDMHWLIHAFFSSPKLKPQVSFPGTLCPTSVCLLNIYIFDFFSRTAGPILTRLGTNHP